MPRLTRYARPLDGGASQFDPILARIGDARTVLIGAATHGSAEFQRMRAALTRQLIADWGFAAVLVEADWPDAHRVNRFVRGESRDRSAFAALGNFERFPTWMWRNRTVADFVTWLRDRNETHRIDDRAGFYGMDLYGLYRSLELVLAYLDDVDPPAAARARERYACFGHFDERADLFARAAGLGLQPGCEREAIAQLLQLRRRAALPRSDDEFASVDEHFFAAQNARLLANAERYYRSMFGGSVASWNLRTEHMMDTCEALREHLASYGAGDKLVIWAHNSHVQDARATELRCIDQLTLGQRMRERHGEDDVVLIGATTHTGTVLAASGWSSGWSSGWGDEPAEVAQLRPSLRGSWERMLHEAGQRRFFIITNEAEEALAEERLTRTIGVVYRPRSERASHYYESRIGRQYDVIVHFDETRALQPLERELLRPALREPAEIHPFGV